MSDLYLSSLSGIISSGVNEIGSIYAERNAKFPTLDDLSTASLVDDPEVARATRFIVAAATQLIASIRAPSQILGEAALSVHCTAAIGAVNDLHVAEILRDAGAEGLHISVIAEKAQTNPDKLARILRYLATRHIFREVTPNVFAANRISSMLDTGISLSTIQANPLDKYAEGCKGISALVGHDTDEAAKGSVYIPEYMRDTAMAFSESAVATPLNMTLSKPQEYFDWMERPENALRLKRLGAAMSSTSSLGWTEETLKAYTWSTLRNNAVVVDVGGGVGSVMLALARAHPHLRYIIQDRDSVISDAKQFWNGRYPSAVENGSVQFQGHDFFKPQPVNNASVFFMRFILHDWPNKHCKDILTHLHAAAQSETRLIVMDHIVPYASPESEDIKHIPGTKTQAVPWPLLPNLGERMVHSLDMQMMTFVNGQERTIGEFIELLNGTGWKLDRIAPSGSAVSHLICSPL